MGDFNEVRSESERYCSIFYPTSANLFNSFIANSGLFDVPLGGYSFTRAYKVAGKMSKLDKFLISEGLLVILPHLAGIVLEHHLFDHRLILLKEKVIDDGPNPFFIFLV